MLSNIRAWFGGKAYKAAQSPPGRAPWNAPAGSANAALRGALENVPRRARDAVRNNPYAARIVDIWEGNAVGAGISTQWSDSRAHADVWQVWANSLEADAQRCLTWFGIQGLVMRSVVESGEVLLRFRATRPTRRNPVGLELLVIEADALALDREGLSTNGNRIIQGIEVDALMRPVAYHIREDRDDVMRRLSEVERVPASEIVHVFRRRRPNQLRDTSWLAPVLWPLRDLGQYEAALMKKAEIEACMAAVIFDDAGDQVTGEQATGVEPVRDAFGNAVEDIQPGMFLYRRNGGSMETITPTGGGSHAGFAKRTLEAAAVGAGLTYDMVAGDLSQANYSSLRAGKIEFRRLLEAVQYRMLIPILVDRVAERFHDMGEMRGLWVGEMPPAVHTPPAPEMIDPAKDTAALIAQVRAGFVSQPEAVAMFGYDFAATMKQIVDANAAADATGVILDTDPRRVAKTGSAQDAAQNAAVEIAATGAAFPTV